MTQVMLVDLSTLLMADGVTDDAPALNAAIDRVRKAHLSFSQYSFACCLRFPAAFIAVKSTINLTSLRGINTTIEGNGAVIVGQCPNMPVVDALDARWLSATDLMIMGDSRYIPSIGLQIGMATSANADNHLFTNVKICGWFSLTCLYNRAAESSGFHHMFLWNSQPNSFNLIQDGLNHYGITSKFVQCTLAKDTNLSFNDNEFLNCDFRHDARGENMWLSDTTGHSFIRSYSETDGDTAVVLYNGANGHRGLNFDCHFETVNLKNIFRISGVSGYVHIRGMTINEHTCYAANSVFVCDPIIAVVELHSLTATIISFGNTSCKVFDNPSIWRVSGSFTTSWGNAWNAINFQGIYFNGLSVKQIGMSSVLPSGNTQQRPTSLTITDTGTQFFDTQVKKVVIWTGTGWVFTDGGPA